MSKKLLLKKTTIVTLEQKELTKVQGGAETLPAGGPMCETGVCQWSVTPTFCW